MKRKHISPQEKRVRKWTSETDRLVKKSRSSQFKDLYELGDATKHLLKAIDDYEMRFGKSSDRFGSPVQTMIRSAAILWKGFRKTFNEEYRNSKGRLRRQRAIWRYVYYSLRYVLPLYDATDQYHKIRSVVRDIRDSLLEYVKYPDRMSGYDPIVLLPVVDYLEKAKVSESECLLIAKTLTKRDKELSDEIRLREQLCLDRRKGENQEIEFIEAFPPTAKDMAKEMAAFSTSNSGRIYLGIRNNGDICGLPDIRGTTDLERKDRNALRIEGIAESIDPRVKVAVNFIDVKGKIVMRIDVPKGSEPVYFADHRPYLRATAKPRLATAGEVKGLHLDYIELMKRAFMREKL